MEEIKNVFTLFTERPKTKEGKETLGLTQVFPAIYFGMKCANLAHQNGNSMTGVIASTIAGVMGSVIVTSIIPAIAYTSPIWITYSLVKIDRVI